MKRILIILAVVMMLQGCTVFTVGNKKLETTPTWFSWVDKEEINPEYNGVNSKILTINNEVEK